MATYNGQEYIYDQLESILNQLAVGDEVIIVDDCSSDNTFKILNGFSDDRIKILKNEVNRGVNSTFERAISLSINPVIFLADQDDIWIDGHIKEMVKCLDEENVNLVTSNFVFIDKLGLFLGDMEDKLNQIQSTQYTQNIKKIFSGSINYFGCCMAFNRSLINMILPIPKFVESHDLWIAMAANLLRSNFHCEKVLLKRRIHGYNVSTVNRNIYKKIISRIYFLISLIIIKQRILKYKF
jgi:glycosyltransferase involved in cell wall biosynthesis